MQDSVRVGECYGITNTKEKSEALSGGGDRFNVLVEPLSLDKLHGVEDAPVGESSDVVNGHDARMLEPRQHQRFANQTVCKIAVSAGHLQNLQRNAALQSLVFGGVHHSHAAARHAFQQAVTRAG